MTLDSTFFLGYLKREGREGHGEGESQAGLRGGGGGAEGYGGWKK